MSSDVEKNMKLSKKCWEQISSEALSYIGGCLGMRKEDFEYSNLKEDCIDKIDVWGHFYKIMYLYNIPIQIRAVHMSNKYYLWVRTHSWSTVKNEYVGSEFYKGDKIRFFVMMWYNDEEKVVDYLIIDWSKLFPEFKKTIFRWEDSTKYGRSFEKNFYYSKFLSSSDHIHKNEFITIPIRTGMLVDHIDKSLETLYPESIIKPVEGNMT